MDYKERMLKEIEQLCQQHEVLKDLEGDSQFAKGPYSSFAANVWDLKCAAEKHLEWYNEAHPINPIAACVETEEDYVRARLSKRSLSANIETEQAIYDCKGMD